MINDTKGKFNKHIFTIPIDNNFLDKDDISLSKGNIGFQLDNYLCSNSNGHKAKTKVLFTSMLRKNWNDIVFSNKAATINMFLNHLQVF